MKQGGVLVFCKYYFIRIVYEINEELIAYGDYGICIYGIWLFIVEGKICIYVVKWKMVCKVVDVQEVVVDQGVCVFWICGNNCFFVENLN